MIVFPSSSDLLLDPDNEGTALLRHIGKYLPFDKKYLANDLNRH